MVRYTKESLETLRQRIDLAEVLSQHIELKRSGSGFKALCPFHDEKSPSFVVNKGDTHYHCFGCGAHGDAIQFLMQHARLTFTNAVVQLAERFQVHLEEMHGTTHETGINRARLKGAVEAACRFYQWSLLHTEEGKSALQYLFKRSISLEFIYTFRVGYAPKKNGLFRKYLHSQGFTDAEMQEAGLITEKKADFFHERIMLPILDPTGIPIGFSARKFKEETFGGKYINTKEIPLFKKSRVLFGLSMSRRRIIKQKQAIIVEGGLDALRMIYHGFDCTVAALGTAFGEEHVQELVQLGVTRVYLLFDGDAAGQKAAVKVGDFFQKRGIEVLVARLATGQDPDSLLVREGPVSIAKAIVSSSDYLSFLLSQYSKEFSADSPAEKQRMLQEIVTLIRQWDSPVMVHQSIKKLSSLSGVPEELLGLSAVRTPSIYIKRPEPIGTRQSIDADRILEADLLRWLILCGFTEKKIVQVCLKNLSESDFLHPLSEKLYQSIIKSLSEEKPVDVLQLVKECDDDEAQVFLSEILDKKVNRDKAFDQCVQTVERILVRNWMRKREEISLKIQAGGLSDQEQIELVKQFDALKKSSVTVSLPET